jgi:lysyl-tRNA synthetase class 2
MKKVRTLMDRLANPEKNDWPFVSGTAVVELAEGNATLEDLGIDSEMSAIGFVTADLFEALVEDHLIQPTIVYDFPLAVSPLSKCRTDDPSLVERFEIYVAGMELGNAFSELNDPAEQERRFRQQVEGGGEEVPREVDMDYIRALAHGMPPTAGEGIGIDRLTMLFTDSHSIREVILFPLLRPEAAADAAAAGASADSPAHSPEPGPGDKK